MTRGLVVATASLVLAGCTMAQHQDGAEIARRTEALLTQQGRSEQAVCVERGLADGTREHALCLIRESERRARGDQRPTITRRLPRHHCWNDNFALALRCQDV